MKARKNKKNKYQQAFSQVKNTNLYKNVHKSYEFCFFETFKNRNLKLSFFFLFIYFIYHSFILVIDFIKMEITVVENMLHLLLNELEHDIFFT